MISYDDYIKRLKEGGVEPDYGQLSAGIKEKIAGRKRSSAKKLVLAGALALMLAGFTFYYSYYNAYSNDILMSYIMNGQEAEQGPVIDYIFIE
jgi:hypothetical protein